MADATTIQVKLGIVTRTEIPFAPPVSHCSFDFGRFTAKGVRGRLRIERDVVAAVCADFDGIEAEHAAQVYGRIRRLSTVAMVAENGELQAGASRRNRDVRLRSGSVRAVMQWP